jgi:LysR family transcriptional regulator, glycine cleavage system transcriptional activator
MSAMHPRRLLPSMTSLMVFEAAARAGSFGRAASRVALTQGAVSKAIATLEQSLGVALFARTGRRVQLTEAGRAYAEQIGVALDQIRRATSAAIETPGSPAPISVATLPSFGMRWLAPRLPRLFARHPDLAVSFATRVAPFDFANASFDAAIHFGDADWQDAGSDFLLHESMIPVCAPQLLREGKLSKPADLAEQTLLEQSTRPDAWREWFERAAVRVETTRPRPKFEHFMMLAQAAAAGAGVALVPRFLVEPELGEGSLVCPFEITLQGRHAYHLVYPYDRLRQPSFARFRDWLLDEARSYRG